MADYQPENMNSVLCDTIYWRDLTPAEQEDHDWLDTEERQKEASFVRYRGVVYWHTTLLAPRIADKVLVDA